MANIKVIADNKQVKALNVKLAKDHVDYFVPLYMDEFAGLKGLALDIHVNGDYSKEGLNALTCWKEMKFSDAFDMKNREQYRPDFHHTPAYGWMNDPMVCSIRMAYGISTSSIILTDHSGRI